MDFDTQIQSVMYRHFAETGRGLLPVDIAKLVGSDVKSVLDSF